jgi:pimeloyl-ACP methyl ester carboxylesterase
MTLVLILVLLVALGAALLLLGGPGAVRFIVLNGAAHGSPKAVLPPDPKYDLIFLQTSGGTKIAAQFGRAQDHAGNLLPDYGIRPSVVYCYPGGGYLKWSQPQFSRLRRLGCNVVMPEYPGYGLSDGTPSEDGCSEAAEAAYRYVLDRSDLDHSLLFAAGWSLGGASVTDLASHHPLAGLVLMGTMTRLSEGVGYFAGRHPLFSWIPHRMLAGDPSLPRLDNVERIARATCPVLVICGAKDPFIPPAMTNRLAAAAAGKSTVVMIPNAGHFDLLKAGGDGLWQTIGDWISTVARQ